MNLFEALMLICFGASWPFAVKKTYTTKNVKGKSRIFLWLVIIGYICGMINRILNGFSWVFYLYLINTVLVGADLFLVYLYRKRDI